jgi:hypothetical protein
MPRTFTRTQGAPKIDARMLDRHTQHVAARIVDAGAELRTDAETGIFAQQLVLHTFSTLFRHEFPERVWMNGDLITKDATVDAGNTHYSYVEKTNSGRAGLVADDATDLPMASGSGKQTQRPVRSVGCAVKWSRQDLRSAARQGLFNIANEKTFEAREAMDFELDELLRTGDAAAGLHGVANQPGIFVRNAAVGNWATATFAQIEADFTAAANTARISTKNVEICDTVVFDVNTNAILTTKPRGPGDNTLTIMDFLKKAHPEITRWAVDPGMDTVSATGGPAILFYRRDPMKVRAVFPMFMQMLPPESRGLGFVINFETRYGGVMTPRTRSILRLDGI